MSISRKDLNIEALSVETTPASGHKLVVQKDGEQEQIDWDDIVAISAALGAVNYIGAWNASTNTPTLASGVGTTGDYHVVSTAGSTNIDSITDWKATDWIVFNGTIWEKVDNSEQTGAQIKIAYEGEADTNAFDDAAVSKLAGIETSATADQTGAEIKTAYEAEANAFTDTQFTKLAGIETSATADQTGAEIKTAYEGEADTNAFDDAAVSKLSGITAGANVVNPMTTQGDTIFGGASGAQTRLAKGTASQVLTMNSGATAPEWVSNAGATVADLTDTETIVDGVSIGATGVNWIQITNSALGNGAIIGSAGTDTNVDINLNPKGTGDVAVTGNITVTGTVDSRDLATDGTKLDTIETSATADQTGAEIKTAYEGEADTNAFDDAAVSKLSGIEASADVTDDVNVRAALAAATADIAVNTQKITGVVDPTADQDAATKIYVDAIATGLDLKDSVRLATDAALTDGTPVYTAGSVEGNGTWTGFGTSLTIDSVATANGDRILIKNEAGTDREGHGIWIVSGVGSAVTLARSVDADNTESNEVSGGMHTFIEEGTVNNGSGWVMNAPTGIAILDTASADNLLFSQFSNIALTNAQIKTAYEANSNTNEFSDSEQTKLAGIATSATANPNALDNVSEDTTPQLSGNLDVSGNSIVSIGAGDIPITPDTTGNVIIDGLNWPQADGAASQSLITDGVGQLSWGTSLATEEVLVAIRNTSGVTINKGDPIYATGWNVGNAVTEVSAADAVGVSTMPSIGLATTSISNNANGFAITVGTLTAINTSAFIDDDPLYVASGKGLTATKPVGTAVIQKVGEVLRSHASLGVIEVFGAGRINDLPNIAQNSLWVGDSNAVPAALAVAASEIVGRKSTGDVVALTATELRTIINVADGANAYTHPNHTGDVTSTGDGATVIADDAVTYAKMQNVVADERLLGNVAGAGGVVAELDQATVITFLAIEANATADQTGAEIKTAYEAEANAYTDTKNTKLAGIATGAIANVGEDTTPTLAGPLVGAGNVVSDVELKDYSETVNVLGDLGGGTDDIDFTVGPVVTATVSTAEETLTFSNPPVTGKAGSFTLFLLNGGSQVLNWPASVDWAGGTAPTLTAAGLDILTFVTLDAGTIWHGFLASADSK